MKRAFLTLVTLILLLGLTNNLVIANAQESQNDSDQITSDEPEDDAPVSESYGSVSFKAMCRFFAQV